MKGIFAVLLIVLSINCVYSQLGTAAQFNTTLLVRTTPTNYTFTPAGSPLGSVLGLTVSASNAVVTSTGGSNVIVYTQTSLPSVFSTNVSLNAGVFANNGLPVGYGTFGTAVVQSALGVGLYVQMSSDIEGNAQANLTVSPSIISALSLTGSLSSFSPLYFDVNTQTYVDLPTSQWYANAASGINVYTNRSVYIFFAVTNPTPIVVSIANGATAYANVVAGRAASLIVNDGTNAALALYNITASAGRVAVRVSANVAAETTAVVSGNALVSAVYSFDHSGGSGAVSYAVLSYDFSSRGLNANTAASVRWYRWNGSNWVQQGGSVNNNVVVYQANGFSDWSAQSGAAAAVTPTPSPSPTSSASCATSFFANVLKYVF